MGMENGVSVLPATIVGRMAVYLNFNEKSICWLAFGLRDTHPKRLGQANCQWRQGAGNVR